MAGAPEPQRETVEVDEVTFRVGEEEWLARRLGSSGGGRTHRAPLMLVGFWHAGEAEGSPLRECTLVGTRLTTLPTELLEGALERSRPWQDPALRESGSKGNTRQRGRGRGPGKGRGGAGRSRPT